MGFLSRHHSGKGPHLAFRGESPGFSQVEAGIMGFLRVMTGTSGTRSCCLRKASLHVTCDELYGIPLLSVQDPRSSFGAEAGTLGFLSSADMDLGVPL